MPTLKFKHKKKKRTRKIQRGGGFFDRIKEKLPNFNIPNPFIQVKANFNSLVSSFKGSICPPCPKSENISSSTNLPKSQPPSQPPSQTPSQPPSQPPSEPIAKTKGGKNHKKRKTTKKRVSRK